MSATPIPRSLASVMYAGCGISAIRDRPPGRAPVKTNLVDPAGGRIRLVEFMLETLRRGEQMFVVCPSIDSEEIANVNDALRTFQRDLGADRVRALHGDMPSAEIEHTLRDFRANTFGVLVSTTIVEVGIDIPRATLMVICDPERLGLSQLHQIRGRVGRGAQPGYCALLTRACGQARQRLEFFARTHDGFELAERDLRERGAGDLAGYEQSGFLEVNVLALAEEAALIQRHLRTTVPANPPGRPPDAAEALAEWARFEVAI